MACAPAVWPATSVSPVHAMEGLRPRLARMTRHWVAVPLSISVASRLMALLLAWMAVKPGGTFGYMLRAWDGGWYTEIGTHGYGPLPVVGNTFHPLQHLVFLPVTPYSARILSELTPLGIVEAGAVISIVTSCIAAVLLWRVVERRFGHDAATMAVTLLMFSPHAFVLSIFYSDGIALCGVACVFWGLDRRWWWLVALAAFVSGLTRPTGFLLALPILIVAVRAWRAREPHAWRGLLAVAAAPAAAATWWLYVAHRTGSFTGYLDMQKAGWNGGVDFGATTMKSIWRAITWSSTDRMEAASAVVLVVVGVLGLVFARRARVPAEWWWYSLAIVLMIAVNQRQSSGPRYLMAAFAVFVGWARVIPKVLRPAAVGVAGAAMAGLAFLTWTTGKYAP